MIDQKLVIGLNLQLQVQPEKLHLIDGRPVARRARPDHPPDRPA